jgi:RNA polymerase subunit RPABC4/transcription elongation factor Spt4
MDLLVVGAVVIGLFILTRIFWLWYFQLDKIEQHLATIAGVSEGGWCGKCNREVSGSFIACPYCAEKSFRHCQECKKKLDSAFKLCPYCGSSNINVASDLKGPAAK